MSRKLILISNEYPPKIGGAGGVAKDIAQSYNNNGQEVIVFTTHESKLLDFSVTRCGEKNIEVISFPVLFNLWFFFFPIYLFFYRKRMNGNIILNDFGAMYSFYFSGLTSRFDYVCYVHGKEPFLYHNSFVRNKIFKFEIVYNKVISRSKSVIFVSKFVRDWFFSRVGPLINYRVVKNCVDLDIFYSVDKKNDDVLFDSLELKNKIVLVTACRLVQGKGFDMKLDVFKKLSDIGSNYIWLIIGDGSYYSEFKKKCYDYGLEGKVVFCGRLKREELKYYYSHCDLFWLLSSFEEAYPLVYHEAQACGLPVMGRNIGGVHEVINDGVDGFVIKSQAEAFDIIYNRKYRQIDLSNWDRKNYSSEALVYKIQNIFL